MMGAGVKGDYLQIIYVAEVVDKNSLACIAGHWSCSEKFRVVSWGTLCLVSLVVNGSYQVALSDLRGWAKHDFEALIPFHPFGSIGLRCSPSWQLEKHPEFLDQYIPVITFPIHDHYLDLLKMLLLDSDGLMHRPRATPRILFQIILSRATSHCATLPRIVLYHSTLLTWSTHPITYPIYTYLVVTYPVVILYILIWYSNYYPLSIFSNCIQHRWCPPPVLSWSINPWILL